MKGEGAAKKRPCHRTAWSAGKRALAFTFRNPRRGPKGVGIEKKSLVGKKLINGDAEGRKK